MPPAVTPIPPWALKEILLQFGLRIVYEDDYNYIFDDPQDTKREPLVLPKIGDVVAVDVMMDTLFKSGLNFAAYLVLKEKILGKDWHYLSESQQNAKAPQKPN